MQPFLKKLKLLIESCPEYVASFDENGTIFEILNVKLFEKEIEKYYKGTLNTFIRQLHLYGFQKISSTRNLRKTELPPASDIFCWSFTHKYLNKHNLNDILICRRNYDKDSEKNLNENEKNLNEKIKDLNFRLESLINYVDILNEKIQELEKNQTNKITGIKRERTFEYTSDYTSDYICPIKELELLID